MEFGWEPTEQRLYENTLEFSRAELCPAAEPESFSRANWEKLGKFGLLGLSVPIEFGGMGLDSLATARTIEAFGRGCIDTGLVFSASAHLLACAMPVVEFGSESLRSKYLPRLSSGEAIGAHAITEAESGSDVFSLRTTARLEGDSYVLNGSKSYVTNGPIADVFLVYATTDPRDGYLGVCAFLVERATTGLTVGNPMNKLGLPSSPTSAVCLDQCRVPADCLVGRPHEGGKIFVNAMQWERSCLFAGYVGLMERQLDQVVQFARERRQFKRPIGKHQAVAHRIAEMKLRLESARLLLYRACWLRDRGESAGLEVSLAKLAISEGAIRSSYDAIHLHGGLGIAAETGIFQALQDAVPSAIFSGTSEIQRDLIARELGL